MCCALRMFGRSGRGQAGPESIRSVFRKFRRILTLNNSVLSIIAGLERASGGEYIFDQAFLQKSVRDLGRLVRQVVYSLNAMTGDSYVSLYDRFQELQHVLDDMLAGGLGPMASEIVIPRADIRWEMEPLAGLPNVCLAEARRRNEADVPDGFAVTVTGCAALTGTDAALAEAAEARILAEAGGLVARTGARLSVSACCAGSFDLPQPPLSRPVSAGLNTLLPVLRAVLLASRAGMAALFPKDAPVSLALCVQEELPGAARGIIRTEDHSGRGPAALSLTAESAEGVSESYRLSRFFPFELQSSAIMAKSGTARMPDGASTLRPAGDRLLRGSGLLTPEQARILADAAMGLERSLGEPLELAWALDGQNRPRLTDVRPSRGTEEDGEDEDVYAGPVEADILAQGGETAQAGVAAGKVVRLRDNDPLEDFPQGAVAVARVAAPRLAVALRRASAVVTEIGSGVGHLAIIAREFRVPALFGVPDALKLLPDGAEVTVDAGEGVIYAGVVDGLLDRRASGYDIGPADPEYAMLRRILRFVAPLSLLDPESPDFKPGGCRSYHDIIHFAHERAVDKLLRINERSMTGLYVHRLAVSAPVDISVIDLDGGLSSRSGPKVGVEDIRSAPFLALLRGMAVKKAWSSKPVGMNVGDIVSGLTRTFAALEAPATAGNSLAIIAKRYLNLSLRLGYHFNVVDAYLGDNPNQNYIYFRFVGGFADDSRRRRRAELIRLLLERLEFKVEVRGDLVTAKLKIAAKPDMERALFNIGQLIGFTRQLDMAMSEDADIDDFADDFLKIEPDPQPSEPGRSA